NDNSEILISCAGKLKKNILELSHSKFTSVKLESLLLFEDLIIKNSFVDPLDIIPRIVSLLFDTNDNISNFSYKLLCKIVKKYYQAFNVSLKKIIIEIYHLYYSSLNITNLSLKNNQIIINNLMNKKMKLL